ncbi:MAG: hypothetical protein U0932_16180 [Thiobacillus sp.]|nr:hypothetical protein [Thiobacillus sp.]MDP2978983.1 hypothetical protein [Thiobacillus sp.]MDZ7596182.1 hypothetical protein [Thiobacillus sp.]
MKTPRIAGRFHWGAADQKNEAIRTERTLIHDQMIIAVTTTMGNP